ncbi:MAG: amino terminal protease self-immunity [Bacteroidetes bacterium]|nr:amino terminal protease self-immunity [Bacteroidota bacterium]
MSKYLFFFKDSKPFVKLLMLICIFMVCTSFVSYLIFFIPMSQLMGQIISQFIMFGASALIWGLVFEGSAYSFIELKRKGFVFYLLSSISLVLFVIPFIDGIGVFNDSWHFNGDEVFRSMENQAKLSMARLLSDKSFTGLLLNIFTLALLPAITEELFFRAAMQKTFVNLVKNQFLGIFLTSIIFSLAHFQLFSFLPRVFLGLFLGYLYTYSKNLIIPIIFHFINNSIVVVAYFLFINKVIDIDFNQVGAIYNPILFTISIIVIGIFFYIGYKKQRKNVSL